MTAQMKALDLYCGLGGWSDGLKAAGFQVNGVEIEPEIASMYKHAVLVADVTLLNPLDYIGYDLIVGSPPCRNFSHLGLLVGHRWKVPPDPEGEGMRLIKAFLNFVEKAKPQYWLMENVPLAVQYVKKHCDLDPRLITRLGKNMRRAFWGNFPAFFITRDYNKKVIGNFKNTVKVDGKYQLSSVYNNPSFIKSRHSKWEAAKIPFPTAFALGNAVKEALSINSKKGGIQTL